MVFVLSVALLAVSAHAESSTVIAEQLRSAGKTVESLAYDQEGCLKEKSWISCERLAKHYDNTSCVHLAYMYYYGQGIEKDYKKSFNLYEGLCERGIYSMCPILSHFYTDGVGMKQDIKKGKEILEKLCYDKYKEGCANLAALYESDQYGMKDEKKTTELYTIACKDDPKSPSCDKIGGTSKRLEFFCTEKSAVIVALSWQILIIKTIRKKNCIFITKLANSDLNVPAMRLKIPLNKKKI